MGRNIWDMRNSVLFSSTLCWVNYYDIQMSMTWLLEFDSVVTVNVETTYFNF